MPAGILCSQRTGNSLIVYWRSKPICFLLKKDPCLHPNPSAALHSRFASSWDFTIKGVFGAVQRQAPLSCSQKGMGGGEPLTVLCLLAKASSSQSPARHGVGVGREGE